MVDRPNIGLIGIGNIGSRLASKIIERDWNLDHVVDMDGIYTLDVNRETGDVRRGDFVSGIKGYGIYLEGKDLTFLTIPTSDDGSKACAYMSTNLLRNIPVVTCEKGALSNHYESFSEFLSQGMIGYSATVGGGTWMLG